MHLLIRSFILCIYLFFHLFYIFWSFFHLIYVRYLFFQFYFMYLFIGARLWVAAANCDAPTLIIKNNC